MRLHTSVHLPRIAFASPGLFRTMEHGFLQQLSCLGACTHARIHLPTVTTLPASDSVLRASSCAYVRLPDYVPASMCPIFPAKRSLFSKTPSRDQSSVERGKAASPNLTRIHLQLIRRQQHHTTLVSRKNATADSAPYGVLHVETEFALCDVGSSKQAQGMT